MNNPENRQKRQQYSKKVLQLPASDTTADTAQVTTADTAQVTTADTTATEPETAETLDLSNPDVFIGSVESTATAEANQQLKQLHDSLVSQRVQQLYQTVFLQAAQVLDQNQQKLDDQAYQLATQRDQGMQKRREILAQFPMLQMPTLETLPALPATDK